ncbi:hypothetical protein ACR77U_12185, partial [Enterococcus faecium]|uniref:hypothetical protein n=1 Tax=Enterococcus faecium TaxID=1352 RepID=UPI003DA62F71
QEDKDYFRRILGVSDFDALRHDRVWRKHPSMAFASLLRHMVMAACRHEFITRNIPVDALDDCRYDVMSRTEELACDVCKSHWGRYGSPDDLNTAVIAIAKAVAEKCGREEK